ncbi:hypothetical protein EDD21DRAFT_41501 [Dissophora ornata]|nr:hypothetical protein EDD21DRAFT_41501 [Dissophora ornata]
MSIFDKLVSNLSELYYHSNPETQQIFAPEHPPDMLYHLFWTFLFIDQEFRNPRARPKVTCNYFVRLLQNEGGGYPRQYFDKKVLKNIYHDIRSRPLLPAPHLIRALQEVDTPGLTNNNNNININNSNNNDGAASYQQQQGVTGPAPHQRRSSSFLNLAHSIKLEDSFKRVRRWWGNSREESGRNQVVWVSHLDSSSTAATSSPPLLLSTTTTTDNVLQDPSESAEHLSESATDLSPRQLIHSSSSTFPASSVPAATSSSSQLRTLRSRFGTKSELAMNKRAMEVSRGVAGIGSNSNSNSSSSTTTTSSSSSALYITSPIMVMDRGFTAVAHGWHAEGDGLDNVVRFPKPRGPSTLGSQYHILQCSELMLEMDLES